MDYQTILDQAQELIQQAEGIVNSPNSTPEEKAKVPEMLVQIRELQATAAQMKDLAQAGTAIREAKMQSPVAQPGGVPAETAGKFADWSEYLAAVWRAQHVDPNVRKMDNRLRQHKDEPTPGHQKQMTEAVGASGGFLVPSEFLAQLQSVQAETELVRPRATVLRIARRQVEIPVLNQTGTTVGQPHWFGGMLGYWAEEAQEKTLTTASFRKVTLVAHKLIGYTRASDELLADSAITLGDFISGRMGFAGLIAWMEDYSFLRGTGAGQPLGVLNAPSTISVARTATSPAIQYVDLVRMLEAFLPTGRGVWLFTQSAMSDLMAVQDPNGSYIWQPNAREGVPQTLFGRPIFFTEKLPAVGSAGDVLLADFSYYLIGDRQVTTIESTTYDKWAYDQTSWRAVHRVDGQPWLSAPLTLADGSSQVSPFVILGAKTT